MGSFPRILVVDDFYGASRDGRNRDRENFCFRIGIADVTGDLPAEALDRPVAEAVFCSGQRLSGRRIENDLAGALGVVCEGFAGPPRWSLVLLDLHFKTGHLGAGEPEGREEDRDPRYYFGLEILKAIREDKALVDLPVIILSSMDRSKGEHAFSGLSALDFCDKTVLDRDKLQRLIVEHGLIEDETILGTSIPLLKSLRDARRRSKHGRDNILVVGESGTGKELVANYIHRVSGRTGTYVPLFTQGVPDSLLEDRLFGHEKGAYSGADTAMPGAAEQADKGTLFIDEFGDIPVAVQAKLLRLLDVNVREVQRLGAKSPKHLDLQVVMATSRLDVLQGEDFRADLLHRAKAFDAIELPPLRERKEDVPFLTERFVRKYEALFGAEKRVIPKETLDLLMAQEWPGNVRDLERVVEHAVLNFKGLRVLSPAHLKLHGPVAVRGSAGGAEKPGAQPAAKELPVCSGVAHGNAADLRGALDSIERFPFQDLTVSDLVGAETRARDAMARCMVGLLRRALVATSRPTTGKPNGEVYYTPAIHLLFGVREEDKAKWRTPKCADQVRQILGISERLKAEFLTDEVLRSAYEAAERLRKRK